MTECSYDARHDAENPHVLGSANASLDEQVLHWVQPLGSLKLAVTLFALSMVLILIGTLAQVERDIGQVLQVYFKAWWTWVDLLVFFPRPWFPQLNPGQATRLFVTGAMTASFLAAGLSWLNGDEVRLGRGMALAILAFATAISASALRLGGFWFPGGAMLGSIAVVNLWVAHATRYRVSARGRRLAAGLVISGLGILITLLVIIAGHYSQGFHGASRAVWEARWLGVKVGLSVAAVGLGMLAIFGTTRRSARALSGGLSLGLAALAGWLWTTGEATYLGDSGMRVLWQLMLATSAASLLLIGGVLLFRQRAGVVVLHLGIGLMMFGQWFVTRFDSEIQMTLSEGQTANYGQDVRSVEFAVIRRQPATPGIDDVLAVPLTMNGSPTRFLDDATITDNRLPFQITIVDFQGSSSVQPNRSTSRMVDAGRHQDYWIMPARPTSGVSPRGVDLASGYFRIVDNQTGRSLGTYLLSQDVVMLPDGQQRRFDLETVTVDGVPYDIQLRFQRIYKDYSITLIDVRKDDYLGTSIPRNYSSRVLLTDPARETKQELTIWMNNPHRYAGDTIYQSSWRQDVFGSEYTTLQVVRNLGWMIPYVACMISIVGMAYHFSLMLLRFLDRKGREELRQHQAGALVAESSSKETVENPLATQSRLETPQDGMQPRREHTTGWPQDAAVTTRRLLQLSRTRLFIPAAITITLGSLFCYLATPARVPSGSMKLFEFGKLPVVHQGRVKPFDTLARNYLRAISEAESFKGVIPAWEMDTAWPKIEQKLKDEYGAIQSQDLTRFKSGDVDGLIRQIVETTHVDELTVRQDVEKLLLERQPAVRWLLDVVSGSGNAQRHKIVRIYHPQVLDTLGLPRRKSYRYSLEEISENMGDFQDQVVQAETIRQRDINSLSLYQRKLLETNRRLQLIQQLHRAFTPPSLADLPSLQDFSADRSKAMQTLKVYREAMRQHELALSAIQPPLAIAPDNKSEDSLWLAYAASWPREALRTRVLGEQAQPSFTALNTILLAYLAGDTSHFNDSIKSYQQWLAQHPPKELQATPSWVNSFVTRFFQNFYHFETYFNLCAPFLVCSFLYLLAAVLPCLGWLTSCAALNRIAYWLILVTFAVHTVALIARMYISGRPPVTNLYSSALFIGWGVVALALTIEPFYRNGLANLTAAVLGFLTLLIAYQLGGDGDTFEVLQAVLDTQFWLATHVVCITLGYSTTFLAGALGTLYVLRGVATPTLNLVARAELGRMIYGALCFAIFFSFFGTVLGGLWADDSWGRFWGWDPKENGALMIVLWNALILHARWDKMIRDRGLAVLAAFGNVVTAWSWFGVNELGVGLHSYGFTEGRLRALVIAVSAQLVVVAMGWLPLSAWWSFRRHQAYANVKPVATTDSSLN